MKLTDTHPGEQADDEFEEILLSPVFLSLKQFCTLVDMAPNTVRVRLANGEIRGFKSGRLWRIPVTEIGRLLG